MTCLQLRMPQNCLAGRGKNVSKKRVVTLSMLQLTKMEEKFNAELEIEIVSEDDFDQIVAVKDEHVQGSPLQQVATVENGSSLLQGRKIKSHLQSFTANSADCDKYMTTAAREMGAFAVGASLSAGAGTVANVAASRYQAFNTVDDAAKMARLGSKLGLAAGGVGLVAAFAGEFLIPDPDEMRIQNLQNGMTCLGDALNKLEQKVKELAADVKVNGQFVAKLSRLPLQIMYESLKTQSGLHNDCTKLMACMSDVSFLIDKFHVNNLESKEDKRAVMKQQCVDHMNKKMESNCDAVAFQKKFQEYADYDFVINSAKHTWVSDAVVAFRDASQRQIRLLV